MRERNGTSAGEECDSEGGGGWGLNCGPQRAGLAQGEDRVGRGRNEGAWASARQRRRGWGGQKPVRSNGHNASKAARELSSKLPGHAANPQRAKPRCPPAHSAVDRRPNTERVLEEVGENKTIPRGKQKRPEGRGITHSKRQTGKFGNQKFRIWQNYPPNKGETAVEHTADKRQWREGAAHGDCPCRRPCSRAPGCGDATESGAGRRRRESGSTAARPPHWVTVSEPASE